MKASFEFIGCGRHRAVWRHGNYVVKVPFCEEGIADNHQERFFWNKYGYERGYVKYARCRLVGSILVMQYVTYPPQYTGLPEWTYAVDCFQVGYNRMNQLVAYDYGS